MIDQAGSICLWAKDISVESLKDVITSAHDIGFSP